MTDGRRGRSANSIPPGVEARLARFREGRCSAIGGTTRFVRAGESPSLSSTVGRPVALLGLSQSALFFDAG